MRSWSTRNQSPGSSAFPMYCVKISLAFSAFVAIEVTPRLERTVVGLRYYSSLTGKETEHRLDRRRFGPIWRTKRVWPLFGQYARGRAAMKRVERRAAFVLWHGEDARSQRCAAVHAQTFTGD